MISLCSIVTNTEIKGHKDMTDFDIAAFVHMKLNYCHLASNIFRLNILKTLYITSYTLHLIHYIASYIWPLTHYFSQIASQTLHLTHFIHTIHL